MCGAFPADPAGPAGVGKRRVPALTRNISASGVLFQLERQLEKGAEIRYSLRMPGPCWVQLMTYWFIAQGVWYAAL